MAKIELDSKLPSLGIDIGSTTAKVAFIENGSWAPMATRRMRAMLEPCKNLSFTESTVKILSAMSEENKGEIAASADELCRE